MSFIGKVHVGAEGVLRLPPGDHEREFVVEHQGDRLVLWQVRLDARRVYIEPTTRCNLDCAMCVRRVWKDPLGEMSWETFQAVLRDLRVFPSCGG